MSPLLEVRRRAVGLVARRQVWPQAVHWIVQVGPVESRLIVPKGESLTVGLLGALASGLFMGWWR